MVIRELGQISYPDAFRLQEQLVAELRQGGEETLLVLEHTPVYTVGSGGDLANVIDPHVQALRVNRGGDVTYHGPGQLVCYPILDLARRGRDLHRYLRFLEGFLVDTCASLGVTGFTIPGKTGVWTERGKLAAIGVGVRRWVSMHGFSLNVAPDTSPFHRINPCGMAGCPITSLSGELGREPAMSTVQSLIQARFGPLLELQLPLHEYLPRTG